MKSYDVKIARVVEETHRVKANSLEDAIENWDIDGEEIERDEEHSGETNLISVTLRDAAPVKAYSVLLAYPQPNGNGEPETYYTHVLAQDVTHAVHMARREALEANTHKGDAWSDYTAEDFYPLLVLAGHIEAEAFGGEL